jgi:hypothetical protein
MTVSIKFKTREFNRELKRAQKKSNDGIGDLIKKVAFKVLRWTIMATPVSESGGQARASWMSKKLGDMAWRIYNNRPYIRMLEYGGYKKLKDMSRKQQKAFFYYLKTGDIDTRRLGTKLVRGKSPYTKDYASVKAPKGMLRMSIEKATKYLRRRS